MTDDEAGIDLAAFYLVQQRLHEAHHVRLPGLHRQPLVHEGAHRDLVVEARVHTRNRNRSALATSLNRLAKRNRTIGFNSSHLLRAVNHVHQAAVMRLHADRINAPVGSDVAGHVLQRLHHVIHFFVVNDFGATFFRHAQAVIETVDRNHALRSEHEGRPNRKLGDRTASPNGDGVAGFNIGVHGSKVAGRINIGEEHQLLIRNSFRHFERPDIGERHARILRLATGVSAHHVRISEKT